MSPNKLQKELIIDYNIKCMLLEFAGNARYSCKLATRPTATSVSIEKVGTFQLI